MGGTSRHRKDIWGNDVTEHFDASGNKTGESRRQAGLFGDYTAHSDSSGSKTGETRDRSGLFGDYQVHEGRWQPIGGLEPVKSRGVVSFGCFLLVGGGQAVR